MAEIYLTVSLSTHNGDDTPQHYIHILIVFVYLGVQHANNACAVLSSVACPTVQYFFPQ